MREEERAMTTVKWSLYPGCTFFIVVNLEKSFFFRVNFFVGRYGLASKNYRRSPDILFDPNFFLPREVGQSRCDSTGFGFLKIPMSLVELEFYLTTDFFFSPKNSIAVYAIRFCRIETENGIRTRIIVAWKKNTCSAARVIGIPPLGGARVMKTPEKRISFFYRVRFFWSFFRHEKYSTDWGCGRSGESRYDCRTRIFFLTTNFFFSPKKLGKKIAGSKQKTGFGPVS